MNAFWKGFLKGFGALGNLLKPVSDTYRTFSEVHWLGTYDATVMVTTRGYLSGEFTVNVYRTLYGVTWFDADTVEEVSFFSQLHDELDRVYQSSANRRAMQRRAAA